MERLAEHFIFLDKRDTSSPVYRQIYSSIRDSILTGRLSPGTRLPASRRMAESLGVSRMTVVNAYDQLFAEGYLEGRQGSGTFVASELPEDFLRVETKRPRQQKGKVAPRRILFSTYGRGVLHGVPRVTSNHSATETIPFQHGLISAEDFPFDLWSKIAQRHLKYSYKTLGGYGDAAGYRPLRSAIAHHLRSTRGVQCEDDQVLITAGTQQAVFLIANLLVSTGEKVWLEDPCHLGASDVMSAIGADAARIPVDEEGFDWARAARTGKPAKLVYVTPSRQFPLGMTMTLQRRLGLLEWAKENDAWVIEDDYDSEFRYSGRPLPSLQGLDRAGRVLYIGTSSKTVFPGLRLGCIVLPPDLVDVFTAARTLTDLHAPLTDQMVLADFIAEGHFERHVRRMRTLYGERQKILVAESQKHLAGFLTVEPSDAGMHLIGWLPKGLDDRKVSDALAAADVKAAPISRYTARRFPRGRLMLGYTAFNERQTRDGIKRLAKVLT